MVSSLWWIQYDDGGDRHDVSCEVGHEWGFLGECREGDLIPITTLQFHVGQWSCPCKVG